MTTEYNTGPTNKLFTITNYKNKKTGSVKFILKINSWRDHITWDHEAIHNHFDPFRNRKLRRWVWGWKYNTKEEAEHLLSIAILKEII